MSLILGLSLLFRGAYTSVSPPELFGDEIDVGYQAISMYRTGRDIYNQPFPLYIHSLSEWRTPLLMYYTVPSVAFLGNTDLGVRAPEIILGTLGVAIIFLLVYETTRSKGISVLSSLSLALTPWHVQYSRAAFEVVLLLDFLMLGTLLAFKKRYLLAAVFFALTPYIYSTAAVFMPLIVLWLYVLYRPGLKIRHAAAFFVILLPFTYNLVFGKAEERFSTVSILGNTQITQESVRIRSFSQSPLEPLFTNRPVLTARKMMDNYLSAFSATFLFTRGDPTIRHNTNFTGQLLPLMALPLALGLYLLVARKKYFWLGWLLLSPIPASLTIDGANHATRLFIMLPPLVLAMGYGLHRLFSGHTKWLLGVPVMFLLLFQYAQFTNYYFFTYPAESWRWWHVGYKTAMTELASLDPQYSRVFINNTYEPSLIRFLFYTGYPPAEFHKVFTLDQPTPDIYPGYYGFFLPPKYYFGDFSLPPNKSLPDVLSPDSLYLISQRDNAWGDWTKNPPGGVKVLFASENPFHDPVLYLVTKAQ